MHVYLQHSLLPGTVRLHHALFAKMKAKVRACRGAGSCIRAVPSLPELSVVPKLRDGSCNTVSVPSPRDTHLGHCSKAGLRLLLKQPPPAFPFLSSFLKCNFAVALAQSLVSNFSPFFIGRRWEGK